MENQECLTHPEGRIRKRLMLYFGVFSLGAAVFFEAWSYNSFKNGFHMDDVVAIQKNLDVVNPGYTNWASFLRHDFWGLDMFSGEWTHKSFRPITTLTYRWNWLLSGLDTSGYHLVNILLHALVSCQMVFVGETVMGLSFEESGMAGMLFAVHPVHTESVLYLVGRADILCGVFMLFGLLLYGKTFTLTSYVCVIVSGLAKEIGFMSFPIMLTMDLISSARRKGVVSLITLLVGTLSMIARHWYTDGTLLKMSPQDNPIAFEEDTVGRIFSYAVVHAEYVRLLIYPMFLCYDYSMNTIPLVCDCFDLRLLAPLAAYLGTCTLITEILQYRLKAGIMGFSIFIFAFIPMSNLLFPVGTVVGERLLYIPSMGFIFLLVLILPRRPLVMIAIIWSLRTIIRIDNWKTANHLTLVDGALNPRSAKTMYNLGVHYFTKQDYERAFHALSLSIEADDLKRDGIAFWRLGQIELMRGNIDSAENLLVSATHKHGAKLMVREEEIFHDAGLACFHNKKVKYAKYLLSAALTLNRVFPKALNNMSCLLASEGDFETALSLLLEASELKPKNVIYSGNVWIVAILANKPDLAEWGRNRTLNTQNSFLPGPTCIWEFKPAEGGPGDTATMD